MAITNQKVVPIRMYELADSQAKRTIKQSPAYKLIFHGPSDQSPETLRKLRGSLLTDLKLSVEEARALLECAPAPVKTSQTASELEPYLELLKCSGANAAIVSDDSEKEPLREMIVDLEPQPKPGEDELEEFKIDTSLLLPNDQESSTHPEEALDLGDQKGLEDEVAKLLSELEQAAPADGESLVPETPPQFELEESQGRKRSNLVMIELETVVEETSPALSPQPAAATLKEPETLVTSNPELKVREADPSPIITKRDPYAHRTDSNRRNFYLPTETLLSILLSILVLLIGNWFYFRDSSRSLEADLIERLLDSAAIDSAQIVDTDVPLASEITQLQGYTNFEGKLEVRSKFDVAQMKVRNASILFTTEPPPELSPFEIVHHKDRDAWLRKVDLRISEFSYLENGIFIGAGMGKAYVEHLDTRFRIPADISIRGELSPDGQTIKAKLRLKIGVSDGTSELPLENPAPGQYRYATVVEFEASAEK